MCFSLLSLTVHQFWFAFCEFCFSYFAANNTTRRPITVDVLINLKAALIPIRTVKFPQKNYLYFCVFVQFDFLCLNYSFIFNRNLFFMNKTAVFVFASTQKAIPKRFQKLDIFRLKRIPENCHEFNKHFSFLNIFVFVIIDYIKKLFYRRCVRF